MDLSGSMNHAETWWQPRLCVVFPLIIQLPFPPSQHSSSSFASPLKTETSPETLDSLWEYGMLYHYNVKLWFKGIEAMTPITLWKWGFNLGDVSVKVSAGIWLSRQVVLLKLRQVALLKPSLLDAYLGVIDLGTVTFWMFILENIFFTSQPTTEFGFTDSTIYDCSLASRLRSLWFEF